MASQVFAIVAIVMTVLFFLIIIGFTIHSMTACNKDTKGKTAKIVIFLYVFALVLLSICMILCIFVSFGFIGNGWIFTLFTARMAFNFATACVQLLFLNTLHITFKNSPSLDYPICVKIAILILIIVNSIFFHFMNVYRHFVDVSVESYNFYIYIPCEFTINFIILILFNRNLLLVIKGQFESMHDEDPSVSVSENATSKKLLDIIVRNIVLFSLIIIAGLSSLTFFAIGSNIDIGLSLQEFQLIYWITTIIYCMSMAMGIYLKMHFSTSVYYKTCKYPHQCCLKCVINVTEKVWQLNTENETKDRLASAINEERMRRMESVPLQYSSPSEVP